MSLNASNVLNNLNINKGNVGSGTKILLLKSMGLITEHPIVFGGIVLAVLLIGGLMIKQGLDRGEGHAQEWVFTITKYAFVFMVTLVLLIVADSGESVVFGFLNR